MAKGQKRYRVLGGGAEQALDQFKYQVAGEVGSTPPPDCYWGDLPARQCGAVGGHMVRRMIQLAEQQMAGGAAAVPPAPQARLTPR